MILWGPTRTGKTLLSRSFGRHSYFSGLFNIDNIDDDADYAVFDDIQGALSTSHLTNVGSAHKQSSRAQTSTATKETSPGASPASGAATMTPEQLAVWTLAGWMAMRK